MNELYTDCLICSGTNKSEIYQITKETQEANLNITVGVNI